MNQFEKAIRQVIEEESRIDKKRTFYPRKVKKAGGFSKKFITCLNDEVSRLQKVDPGITFDHLLKCLDFEVKRKKE